MVGVGGGAVGGGGHGQEVAQINPRLDAGLARVGGPCEKGKPSKF